MKLRDETIVIDGRPVHLLRGGTGPNLLVLHGWGSAADRYRETFAEVPEREVSVVIPDLPGFGLTPAPLSPWGIEAYAAWVQSLVRVLGLQQVVLAGHSFGGALAVFLGANAPERIRGLVLIAPRGMSDRPALRLAAFRSLAKAGKVILRFLGLRRLESLGRRLLYRLAGTKDTPPAGPLRETFRKIIAFDPLRHLSRIRVPTVVLWGREDRVTPVAGAARLQRYLPEATVRILDGVGHAPYLESPKRFARALLDALQEFRRP